MTTKASLLSSFGVCTWCVLEYDDEISLLCLCCFLLSCKKRQWTWAHCCFLFLQIPQKMTMNLGSSLSSFFLVMILFYWDDANDNKLAMLVILFFWLHCHRRWQWVSKVHCRLHLFWLVVDDNKRDWLIVVSSCVDAL